MPRVTKQQLTRYVEINNEAAELARKARTLKAEAKRIEEDAQADLESSGKESVTRGGFRLHWKEKAASISWKNELVDAKGVDFVARLQAKAGVVKSVLIEVPKA